MTHVLGFDARPTAVGKPPITGRSRKTRRTTTPLTHCHSLTPRQSPESEFLRVLRTHDSPRGSPPIPLSHAASVETVSASKRGRAPSPCKSLRSAAPNRHPDAVVYPGEQRGTCCKACRASLMASLLSVCQAEAPSPTAVNHAPSQCLHRCLIDRRNRLHLRQALVKV